MVMNKIVIVAHGGAKNDTILTIETKNKQPTLFDQCFLQYD